MRREREEGIGTHRAQQQKRAIEKLRSKIGKAMTVEYEGIAIIGMAGRFPGAESVEEFWQNLVAGKESVSFFSDSELAEIGLERRGTQECDAICSRPRRS